MFRPNGKIALKQVVIAPILLAILIIAGCSSISTGSSRDNTDVRTNTGGEVTIAVKNLGINDNELSFNVVMDTHSVNLDQYDLNQLATLRDDKGNEYQPVSWDSAAGGHHRKGKLTFAQIDSPGQLGALELNIRNVAGVPDRIFRWTVGAG